MVMPGRKYQAAGGLYRYGFNGKEKDNETTGSSTYDYGFRIYSPAIARFLFHVLQFKFKFLTLILNCLLFRVPYMCCISAGRAKNMIKKLPATPQITSGAKC
jgi:hypothetical protein